MGNIIIKRTSILIENYKQNINSEFESMFCYPDLKNPNNIIYSNCLEFYKNDAIIPRGMIKDLNNAIYRLGMLHKKIVIDDSCDDFDKLTNINIKSLPRDDIQREAIRFMIGTDEYAENANLSQYSINLNTGAGKTYVTIMTSIALELKPIIIASTVGWINQWQEKYLEYTDIKPEEIYVVQGSSTITAILQGLVDLNKYKVFFATHSTLHSYGNKYGWDKITKFFKLIRVGMKVYDEAHINFDNICSIDFHTNTYKTYYLTATPARSNRDENNVYQTIFLKNIAKIDLFDSDRDRRTIYTAYLFKSNPTQQERKACSSFYYGLNRIKYMNYLVNKPAYAAILHYLINEYFNINGKILIYIGTNEAIFQTRMWILEHYPEYIPEIGVYTSMVGKDDKREELNKRIILSTTKSAGAASDIAGLKLVIVLDEPFRSEVLARQTLGRARDYKTIYFDFVDTSFYELKNFYKSKLKRVFQKYALACQEVDMTETLEDTLEQYEQNQSQKYKMPSVNYIPVMMPDIPQQTIPFIPLREFDNNVFSSEQSNTTNRFWRARE